MKTLRTLMAPALLAVLLLGTGFLAGCREHRRHHVAYQSEPTLCWKSDSDHRPRDDRRHAPTPQPRRDEDRRHASARHPSRDEDRHSAPARHPPQDDNRRAVPLRHPIRDDDRHEHHRR